MLWRTDRQLSDATEFAVKVIAAKEDFRLGSDF